jgi:hypothetical protein
VLKPRGSWLASGAVHVVLLAALAVGFAARNTPRVTFLSLDSPRAVALPPAPPGAVGRHGPSGARQPAGPSIPVPPAPSHPAPAPLTGRIIASPRLSDARIWPVPRPALPTEVADALYNPDTAARDTAVVHRLRAMVDSLNRVIDQDQREHRLPSWTTDVAGKKFGIDSSGIYVAGVKIPTAALALLGNMLPQGNFDESLRARQMEYMRQDIIQAARRTETLQQFRKYVRELRERKQSERDADKRARGDTAKARPDTVRVTP